MAIRKVYVVHHSHTDIGYTDLQERVIDTQVDYIRTVLKMMEQPEYAAFRWNCETLFCVEAFLKTATPAEQQKFWALAAAGKIGISANYLNFNDLADSEVLGRRLKHWSARFAAENAPMRTAMMADINGISMGQRDAMLNNGVEFLFTNIHCHHGMYPLHQNQNAYFWENAAGKRLLVWNGEHYNLGNVLGLKTNRAANYMMQNHMGNRKIDREPVEELHENLREYLSLCQQHGYAYDFLITAVSGVFSDNAPPEPEILQNIQAHNARYGQEVEIQMVSLQELYAAVREALKDAPVYRGDLTDWWANGAGSTPYAVKHYREAQHRWQLCNRLDPEIAEKKPNLAAAAEDNLLLYAEHTWGHSSTVTNPYDTMVLNLDMRKNSYASKAHEAASLALNHISAENGDILRYYSTQGEIQACSAGAAEGLQLVEFYIESPHLAAAEVETMQGQKIPCQVSPDPRGRRISFTDSFLPKERKNYRFREIPKLPETLNSRKAYVGSERVRDIINDYDPVSYQLPYGFENDFFKLSYRVEEGITEFVDKRTGKNLLSGTGTPFFTPMYENTPVNLEKDGDVYAQRSNLGRNIRGKAAKLYTGELEAVDCLERGPIFTVLCLRYRLPGTMHCRVYIKLYAQLPRIDFRMELGKTLSQDIESIFLPMTLHFENPALYLRKGTEAYLPGVEQIPGTCMEYSMSDAGIAYLSENGGALIAARDTPLFYMGEMRHHPIRLCDNKPENNRRNIYSWVMNNTWETNFKMDLSGFGEYAYSLWLTEETQPERAMDDLQEKCFDPHVLIVG